MRHLEARGVAKYKLPEFLTLVPELPMTSSGKVQKFVLRERFMREHGQAGGSA
ncbi:fatty-acyl-CoA synthase/cyclohexanecarboxylate-CoA ligase/acyl-CoA synthetase [Belnapia rosea]|nr:fatty-acyl-CoA synthase/cyclohexanecarboxylate-CoA ligase/acyl-CoA synthetase [Belnapia rosea]